MEFIKKIENRQFRQTRCDSEAFGGRSLRSQNTLKLQKSSIIFFDFSMKYWILQPNEFFLKIDFPNFLETFIIVGQGGPIRTVFENRSKSRIQHCERSELRLHFEWTKVNQKCQKMKLRSNRVTRLLIGQISVKNAKIEKFKCDILSHFQTLWGPKILFQKKVIFTSNKK